MAKESFDKAFDSFMETAEEAPAEEAPVEEAPAEEAEAVEEPAEETEQGESPQEAEATTDGEEEASAEETPQAEPTEGGGEAEPSEELQAATEAVEEQKRKLAGKYDSPEELEAGYAELRRLQQEQATELRKLRESLQNVPEPAADTPAAEQPGFNLAQPTNLEELGSLLETNPDQGIMFIAQNAPDLAPSAFAHLENMFGAEKAWEAEQNFNQFMMYQQHQVLEQQMEEKLKPLQEELAPLKRELEEKRSQKEAADLIGSVREKFGAENVDAVKQDLVPLVREQLAAYNSDDFGNPLPESEWVAPSKAQLRVMTEQAVRVALAERRVAARQRQAELEARSAVDDFVEQGTPTQSVAPEPTAEEENRSIAEEIMDA